MRIETSFGFDHERTQGALLWRGSREEYEAYTREHPIIRLANEPLLTPAIEALLESTGCQMLSDESIRLASREQTNYLQEREIPFKIEREIKKTLIFCLGFLDAQSARTHFDIIVCPRY